MKVKYWLLIFGDQRIRWQNDTCSNTVTVKINTSAVPGYKLQVIINAR